MDIRADTDWSEERPTWDEIRISMCEVLAKRSTCWKKQTAAIITNENRIISEGYNGVPSYEPHCVDVGPRERFAHREWSKDHEIHAEMNAILHASRNGGIPENSEMFTLLSPCIKCAQAIVSVGISRVVYTEPYRLYNEGGKDYLESHGIAVEKFIRRHKALKDEAFLLD